MNINLSPIAGQVKTVVKVVDENTIIYNGTTYDFTAIPNGGEAIAREPAIGKITKSTDGIVTLTIKWIYKSKDSVTADRFPTTHTI